MKFFASIFLASFFLLQSFASEIDLCCDMEDISGFFSHYQDHNNTEGESFYEFICEVYLSTDGDTHGHENSKKQNHDDAPCQNCSQCTHIYQAPITFKTFEETAILTTSFTKQNSTYSFSLNTSFLDKPFQPPKV